MLDLTITSVSPVAFGEESGLDALDYETEFRGMDQDGATTRVYRLTNAAWDRLRPRLRDLAARRVPNVDGNGVVIPGSFRPLLEYSLVPVPGNFPRFTRIEATTPLSLTATGVLTVRGTNLLGGIKAKLDISVQSGSPRNVMTGQRRFNTAVKALRVTAVPVGPRGRMIGFCIREASGAGSVVTELVGEQQVNITVTPASGANTAQNIADQVAANPSASYYVTLTALSPSTRIGPTVVDYSRTPPPPQVTRKEFLYLQGGDGGGLAELFVPTTEGSPANGLVLVAQKGGNPGSGISLVLLMDQLSNSVAVSGKKITVSRTGSTETLTNLASAINGNASAAALVAASVRGTGSLTLGAMTERFLYGGGGEEVVATVGGAAAAVTSHTDTAMVLTVAHTDLVAAGVDVQQDVLVQVLVGDRMVSGQVAMGAERRASLFRAAVRAQASVTLSAPGATIDGVTMAAGMRFWAPSQGTATQDGLYVWNGAATPATRAPEMPAGFDASGVLVAITGGTDAGTVAICTNAPGAGRVGTDGLTDAIV